jgi:anti-sigma factor RsiW
VLVSREVDGESIGDGRGELERHLASCDACRRFRERARSLQAVHRSLPEAPPGPRLIASILAAAGKRRESSPMRGWLRFAVPAVAAAVFVLGFWIGSLMHEQYRTAGASTLASGAEALELEYLDECPPGSFGSIFTVSYEGGSYETGRP